jgi:hypothetical protein
MHVVTIIPWIQLTILDKNLFVPHFLVAMKALFQLNETLLIPCFGLTLSTSNRKGSQIKHTMFFLFLCKVLLYNLDLNKNSRTHFCIFNY